MTIPSFASFIQSVTVFRAGARVTRVAEVAPGEGGLPETIRVSNLPLALDDGSIGVELRGQGSLPIATDVRVALEVPDAGGPLAPPKNEELIAARREEAAASAHIAQLEREKKWVEALDIGPRGQPELGQPPIVSPTAARLGLIGFRAERTEALIAALRTGRERLRHATRKKLQIEDRERRATTARQARPDELRKSAIITLARNGADPAGPLQVVLTYLVAGARWAPAYQLRFDKTLGKGALSMRAMVRQRTGEDWDGVELVLSTAAAQRWTELPEMKAIRIGRRQPPAPPAWRAPPTGVELLYADYDAAVSSLGAAPVPPPPAPEPPRYDEVAEARFASGDTYDEDESPGEVELDDEESPTGSFQRAEMSYDYAAKSRSAPADGDGAMVEGAALMPPGAIAPPMARSRGGLNIGGLFGGGGAPPPAPAAPAAAPRKSRSIVERFAGAPAAKEMLSELEAQAPAEDVLVPDEALLRYGALHMPGASVFRRGHLEPDSKRDRYMHLLAIQHVSVQFDVIQAIELVVAEAHAADRGPAPERHRFAQSDGSYDYAYRAEAASSIPSDGAFHSIPIIDRDVRSRARFVSVPQRTQDVFRIVDVDNPLDAPLLPGPADVYVGNEYLLTADLSTTAPAGKLKVGLGVEQRIKISRNLRFEEKTAGLMRGSLDLVHAVEIDVLNHLDRPALVEVRERVPVKVENDKDVEVAVERVEPAWQPYEQDDQVLKGGYAWRVTVAPDEKKRLSATYAIRIPGNSELHGGNRRA